VIQKFSGELTRQVKPVEESTLCSHLSARNGPVCAGMCRYTIPEPSVPELYTGTYQYIGRTMFFKDRNATVYRY
jgi:hypothetical protein